MFVVIEDECINLNAYHKVMLRADMGETSKQKKMAYAVSAVAFQRGRTAEVVDDILVTFDKELVLRLYRYITGHIADNVVLNLMEWLPPDAEFREGYYVAPLRWGKARKETGKEHV